MAYTLDEKLFTKIKDICLKAYDMNLTDPIELIQTIWDCQDFPMHCPEHHVLVPAVLLTVYRTLRNDSRAVLEESLQIAETRGRNLLPGFCGYYGACGAGIGGGLFLAILTDTTPLSVKTWGMANKLTSICLESISESGGPRCCKRVSYLTIEKTLPFVREQLGLDIQFSSNIQCSNHERNNECLRAACPYYEENHNG